MRVCPPSGPCRLLVAVFPPPGVEVDLFGALAVCEHHDGRRDGPDQRGEDLGGERERDTQVSHPPPQPGDLVEHLEAADEHATLLGGLLTGTASAVVVVGLEGGPGAVLVGLVALVPEPQLREPAVELDGDGQLPVPPERCRDEPAQRDGSVGAPVQVQGDHRVDRQQCHDDEPERQSQERDEDLLLPSLLPVDLAVVLGGELGVELEVHGLDELPDAADEAGDQDERHGGIHHVEQDVHVCTPLTLMRRR